MRQSADNWSMHMPQLCARRQALTRLQSNKLLAQPHFVSLCLGFPPQMSTSVLQMRCCAAQTACATTPLAATPAPARMATRWSAPLAQVSRAVGQPAHLRGRSAPSLAVLHAIAWQPRALGAQRIANSATGDARPRGLTACCCAQPAGRRCVPLTSQTSTSAPTASRTACPRPRAWTRTPPSTAPSLCAHAPAATHQAQTTGPAMVRQSPGSKG